MRISEREEKEAAAHLGFIDPDVVKFKIGCRRRKDSCFYLIIDRDFIYGGTKEGSRCM